MRRKILSFLMVMVMVSLCVQGLSAQAKEQNSQLFAVWDIKIFPSKFIEFEAAVKDLLVFFSKYKYPYPFSVYRTNDFHYYVLAPMENMAAIDDMNKFQEELEKKAGEEVKANRKRRSSTYESETFGTLDLRSDLSYYPGNPRLKSENADFIWWNYYYIKHGKLAEAEKIAGEWQALYKSKNIPDGYNIWVTDMWPDRPALIAAGRAKSASDYYTQFEKHKIIFGEKYKALAKKTMDICRKFEHRTGYHLRELSYQPKKQEKKKIEL